MSQEPFYFLDTSAYVSMLENPLWQRSIPQYFNGCMPQRILSETRSLLNAGDRKIGHLKDDQRAKLLGQLGEVVTFQDPEISSELLDAQERTRPELRRYNSDELSEEDLLLIESAKRCKVLAPDSDVYVVSGDRAIAYTTQNLYTGLDFNLEVIHPFSYGENLLNSTRKDILMFDDILDDLSVVQDGNYYVAYHSERSFLIVYGVFHHTALREIMRKRHSTFPIFIDQKKIDVARESMARMAVHGGNLWLGDKSRFPSLEYWENPWKRSKALQVAKGIRSKNEGVALKYIGMIKPEEINSRLLYSIDEYRFRERYHPNQVARVIRKREELSDLLAA